MSIHLFQLSGLCCGKQIPSAPPQCHYSILVLLKILVYILANVKAILVFSLQNIARKIMICKYWSWKIYILSTSTRGEDKIEMSNYCSFKLLIFSTFISFIHCIVDEDAIFSKMKDRNSFIHTELMQYYFLRNQTLSRKFYLSFIKIAHI